MTFAECATEGLIRGWMWKFGGKSGAFKRKRWFVLRGDVISYYKNKVIIYDQSISASF